MTQPVPLPLETLPWREDGEAAPQRKAVDKLVPNQGPTIRSGSPEGSGIQLVGMQGGLLGRGGNPAELWGRSPLVFSG